jgi:hypothetical protein
VLTWLLAKKFPYALNASRARPEESAWTHKDAQPAGPDREVGKAPLA